MQNLCKNTSFLHHSLLFSFLNDLVKKHSKPTPQGDEGGIIDQEIPIDKSNLMLIDPKSKKPTRVGFKENKKGITLRFSKKSGDFING